MKMMKFYLLSSLLLVFPLLALCDDRQVYIVYMGEHSGDKTHQEIEDNHHSYLVSVKSSEEEARSSIVYSYKNSINGFAALLTADEAAILSQRNGVLRTFPSHNKYSLDTTGSWKFLGLEEGIGNGRKVGKSRGSEILHKAKYGKDVIVGLLDSGIWPESQSFHDQGLGPVPERWKGICEEGDSFDSSHCNNKLIGGRFYVKGYETDGALNRSNDYRSPRDKDGHGTHTSSTAGGRSVHNVGALGGFAHGSASGGAPLVRLAMYKVCWPVHGVTLQDGDTCYGADMLAAIDDAIGDGVDVISMSIGGGDVPFSQDVVAIATLHATKRNIVVACSAGNDGPTPSTVANTSPWILTVGASSTNRDAPAPVELGNNMKIKGESITPSKLKNHFYPLVYGGDVASPHVNSTPGQCLPGSLSLEKTKDKVVLCFRGEGTRVKKGAEVKRAGGAGMILANAATSGSEIIVDAHVLPATAVSNDDGTMILNYIQSAKNPTVKLSPGKTVFDDKPAPYMAGFSSTGPNPVYPNIIKPDITAPGINILAAWSRASSPTGLDADKRRVKYSFESGTSMSCPHIAGIVALVKAIHPTWTSAAIRSAIMTTATTKNSIGKLILTASGKEANPFNYGAGHVRPSKAYDPGLVYDATYTDYLLQLCDNGDGQVDPNFKCPEIPPTTSDLNYPSLSISNLNGSVTVKRTVTNVGGNGKAVYFANIDQQPEGFIFEIHPKILRFSHVGDKKRFMVTVKKERKTTAGEYSFGWYSWTDGIHVVRSPIAVSSSV
ncbi:hypothetical protein GIB67_034822 [Kingdonia uniflora]|uniref:Subtilisin-like protease SBT5.6 n=1 Tax=Kingdonia uniflora TaxID=39325 RepID=A0A7J7ME81_9MAGN|nr:hypothetical protein GIB67_034822 [Kingdonia uniflora]